MNKNTITDLLNENYVSFIDYINALTSEEYNFSFQNKWSAAQQLEHIILCVKPLVKVFGMEKTEIGQNFGKSDRPSRTYKVLLHEYLKKLNEGGKAPDRFVPVNIPANQKEVSTGLLKKMITDLCLLIEKFSEQELDAFYIPHPLLQNLTLREMLYNAIYHVEHHHEAAKQNLTAKTILPWADAWTSSGREHPEELLLSFYTDDCFYSDPGIREGISGKEKLRTYFKKLLYHNPAWVWKVLEIIPTTKGCVVKWEVNLPVNQEAVIETGVDIIEIKENKIHRYEAYFDRHKWLTKLSTTK